MHIIGAGCYEFQNQSIWRFWNFEILISIASAVFHTQISKLKSENSNIFINNANLSNLSIYLYPLNKYIARVMNAIYPAMFSQIRAMTDKHEFSSREQRALARCARDNATQLAYNVRYTTGGREGEEGDVGAPALYNDTEWINPPPGDATRWQPTRSGIIDMLFLCFAYS